MRWLYLTILLVPGGIALYIILWIFYRGPAHKLDIDDYINEGIED